MRVAKFKPPCTRCGVEFYTRTYDDLMECITYICVGCGYILEEVPVSGRGGVWDD